MNPLPNQAACTGAAVATQPPVGLRRLVLALGGATLASYAIEAEQALDFGLERTAKYYAPAGATVAQP